jgi:hypothetical protein
VYLVNGDLLVAHDADHIRLDRTLEALYLDPPCEPVWHSDGHLYQQGLECTLLIDVKSPAESTYAVLREVVARYADILTRFRGDTVEPRALTAIISSRWTSSLNGSTSTSLLLSRSGLRRVRVPADGRTRARGVGHVSTAARGQYSGDGDMADPESAPTTATGVDVDVPSTSRFEMRKSVVERPQQPQLLRADVEQLPDRSVRL